MQIWALIVDSFRDSIDRKMFWVMCVLTALVAAAMACISFDESGISLLFGAWKFEHDIWTLANPQFSSLIGTVVVKFVADNYLGFFGIIIALITTAGVFPGLMESGTIDLLLAKPMARWKLFLGKYLGALMFVFLQATLFVGLTFLVMGTRWQVWIWGYFGFIPLMVILFSYLYAFTVLFGILTRSSLTSLMLTLVAWMVIWMPPVVADLLSNPEVISASPDSENESADVESSLEKWGRVFRAITWVIPKTADITEIAGDWVGGALISDVVLSFGASMPEEDRREIEKSRELEEQTSHVNAWASIGSSLASETVVVLIAMYYFRRRDF